MSECSSSKSVDSIKEEFEEDDKLVCEEKDDLEE